MAKKDRGCHGKVRHRDKGGAAIASKKLGWVGLNVYKCNSCGFWHVGKSRSQTRGADRIGMLLERHEMHLKDRMKVEDDTQS